MRDGVLATIEKKVNGFTVCVVDPQIKKANAKANSRWRDPEIEYVFPNLKKALAWINENADKLALEPEDDKSAFTSAWNEATTEEDN